MPIWAEYEEFLRMLNFLKVISGLFVTLVSEPALPFLASSKPFLKQVVSLGFLLKGAASL